MATPQEDTTTWQIIYPVYIDQNQSQRKGRRISKEFAIPNPTASELHKAIQSLSIPCHLDADKRHPSTPRSMGRVRIQLKDDAGDLLDDQVDSKQTLLLLIAAKIATERQENALKNPVPAANKAGAKATKGKGKK